MKYEIEKNPEPKENMTKILNQEEIWEKELKKP